MANKSEAAKGDKAPPQTRLALDRYVVGLWNDADLAGFLEAKKPGHPPLLPLLKVPSLDRARAAQKLRKELFGSERSGEVEKLEALIREGVERAEAGMPILAELQHDLLANASAVPKGDPRSQAVAVLADLAAASQVNVSIQAVGHIAETTTDRVQKARADALAKLSEALAKHPHLAPGAKG